MLLAITTTGKVVLILVAATFISFSLLVSMVVPRRWPEFPGSKLPTFVAVCLLLFGAQIAAVAWVTGTQEVEARAAETPTTTTPTASTTTAASEPGDAAAGKAIFTGSAGCKNCHTLKDAGATGTVGPNLDDKKPPYALVIDRVTHGKGVMPSFSGKLSKTDIENVAKYVSSVAGT
ncbi:MAG TPA: cytochrome c [Gaiellaceae bacterium]|nr:cytochrome c [Gaiellaceae bacterium]